MKYDNIDVSIRDVQMVQLEILNEFDRICKIHNIKYQLFAGTLLGAVRHKGFIPWDDDIDVCLLRKDYDKFIKACEIELDEKYFLQTYLTDKDYIMQFAKIRKNNTLFIEESIVDVEQHKGIFIDIFPLDDIFPDTIIGRLHKKVLHFLNIMNFSRLKNICLKISSPYKKYVILTLHYIVKIIPKSWMDTLLTKVLTTFNNKGAKYVSHLTNGASNSTYRRYMMEKDKFYDTIDGTFEDGNYPIPRDYRNVLTKLFGDYMKLPPKDNQKPHHGVVKVSFNKTSEKTF